MVQLKITQVKSSIGKEESQGLTLRALGIRRHQQSVVKDDSPQIRGMIHKIRHLVKVEEIS